MAQVMKREVGNACFSACRRERLLNVRVPRFGVGIVKTYSAIPVAGEGFGLFREHLQKVRGFMLYADLNAKGNLSNDTPVNSIAGERSSQTQCDQARKGVNERKWKTEPNHDITRRRSVLCSPCPILDERHEKEISSSHAHIGIFPLLGLLSRILKGGEFGRTSGGANRHPIRPAI